MRRDAAFWIDHLKLTRHIEGGSFAEFYRSPLVVPKSELPIAFSGDRSISTSIYFLLEVNQFSALHRISSDELWHFYTGDRLEIFEIEPSGNLKVHLLGSDPQKGESFQCVIRAGNWFGSKLADGGEFCLVGCTVSPGFDFEDFELADREELQNQFPQHTELIHTLTR